MPKPNGIPRRSPSFSLLSHRALNLPQRLFWSILHSIYAAYQLVLASLFAPPYSPPKEGAKYGRVAIIGAGLTGVSSAAHFVAHGFEVVIYEADGQVGGIWARVNETSSLQLNSMLYRFHPRVMWSKGFPRRDEIVAQIEKIWKEYHLESSTRLNTRVTKVTRHALSTNPRNGGHARWVINDGEDGIFDSIVVAVGTCGNPKKAVIPGSEVFHDGKDVVHSSELDGIDLEGKEVIIVGSGASGVEAAELAINKQAKRVIVLARSDKWIIPRSTLFDVILSLQPFGREMPLSFIPEWIVKTFFYRDQADKAPKTKGLFQGTPIVNDVFLNHIRHSKVLYKKGNTKEIVQDGITFIERESGKETLIKGDLIVMATGFEKPSIEALPDDLFPVEGDRNYQRPNLYLQNFSTEDWSVLLTNASYQDAIGTVGNWHIGLYARILIIFLLDPKARPSPSGMKLWVDLLTWLKTASFGNTSGLAFFTYAELCIWIVSFHFLNLRRLPWLLFVLFGWGVPPNQNLKEQLHKIR